MITDKQTIELQQQANKKLQRTIEKLINENQQLSTEIDRLNSKIDWLRNNTKLVLTNKLEWSRDL